MEKFDLYTDIATRTNGDIYIGVVGPVRTGKSTFITKFMEGLVLPNIDDENRKNRIIDEMPQSADGKTIMTSKPQFVPDGGVKVNLAENIGVNVRLIDCVGYIVDDAEGYREDGKSRLVRTPWSEKEMTFEEAAEFGTRKVITDHSTIGIMVTTDGSIGGLARDSYINAEKRVVAEMKEIGKPFVCLLNCKVVGDEQIQLADTLAQEYGCPVVAKNVKDMSTQDIAEILQEVLMQFPLKRVDMDIPKWLQALPISSEIIKHILFKLGKKVDAMNKMADYKMLEDMYAEDEYMLEKLNLDINFGAGRIVITPNPRPELFYWVLSEECGMEIKDDFELVSYIKGAKEAKEKYSKLKTALDEVEITGYGVVVPNTADMELDEPRIVKKGSKYSIKLGARAASYHIMKVDVQTEVNPIMGGEAQSEDMLRAWLDELEEKNNGVWNTTLLGKSMNEIARDNLAGKLQNMPNEARGKLQKTVTRIVNEGKGGVLCILL